MDLIRIPLGAWVEALVNGVIDVLGGFFDVVSTIFGGLYDGAEWPRAGVSRPARSSGCS